MPVKTAPASDAPTITPEQKLALQDVDTAHKRFGIAFKKAKEDPSEENIALLNKAMTAISERIEALGVLCMK